MAFERPWGSLQLDSRSSDDLDRDDALVDALAKLVPEDAVRRAVTVCLRKLLQREVSVAFGNPPAVFESMGRGRGAARAMHVGVGPIMRFAHYASAELSAPFGDDFAAGEAFGNMAIAEELRPPEPSSGFLANEIVTARFEVARDWLSGVSLAWESWGEALGALRLDATSLMPLNPDGEHETAFIAWKQRREEGLVSLTASVALDAEGYGVVMTSFADAIARQVQHERVLELPDGMRLSSREGELVVEQATQRDEATASS